MAPTSLAHPAPVAQPPALPRFTGRSPLRTELEQAVDAYFAETGYARHGGGYMWLKTATIFAWAIASYALLLLWAPSAWAAVPLAVSLGLALAGVGFSVMHDGGHGSYSNKRSVNRLAARALDLLGGSSFMWHHKHNVLHHTYTNVDGVDDDIEFQPLFRLASSQPRRAFHRLQFLYWIPLFLLFPTKWIFLDDFVGLGTGRIGQHKLPRLSRTDLCVLFGGKLFFLSWAIALPLLLGVPPLTLLGVYLLVTGVEGLTLGTVFQLAHVVPELATYERAERMPLPWAEHQIATTSDFARGNRLLGWYVGGLNYQVEHHLFAKVGHRHYPALAKIVRDVCPRHGVEVHEHRTLIGALVAHVRQMYRLGNTAPTAV